MNSIKSAAAAFSKLWRRREGLNLRSVRPAMLCYTLAYVAELVLYDVKAFFMPVETGLLGLSGWTYMYLGHILASLVVMLLWSKRFKHLVYISVAVMLAGFLPFIFLPEGHVRLAFAVLAFAGLGGAVSAARCGYAFAANNAERLVGMLIVMGISAAFYFMKAMKAGGPLVTQLLPLLVLGVLAFCLLKFKEKDLEAKEESTQTDAKGLYWALAYFIAYFAFRGYIGNQATQRSSLDYTLLGVGLLVSILIFAAVLVFVRKSIWHIWNLFFLFSILAAVFALFRPQMGTDAPFYLFNGLHIIGWGAGIYMLACAQRRFASYKLLKKSTVIFVALSPLTTLSSDVVLSFFPGAMPLVTFAYVLAVSIGFLLLSPISYKHLFSAVWLGSLYQNDMDMLRGKVDEADRFERYGLTPREKEVATLFLAANTTRMVAGELKISQSTVNMHAANLYRKLNINSKAELFRKFGVAEETGP